MLSGDVPLIREETLRAICELHLKENAAMTILTAEPTKQQQCADVDRLHSSGSDIASRAVDFEVE